MGKLLIVLSFALLITYVYAQTKSCPLSSKMTNCSPKCKDDTECFGKRCCPNICNTKSCAPENLTSQSTGYKDSKSTATGTYCGNEKCSSFQKCELDRSTKRQRCVRA